MSYKYKETIILVIILSFVSLLCYTITSLLNIQNVIIYQSLSNVTITWEIILFFIFMLPTSAILDRLEICTY